MIYMNILDRYIIRKFLVSYLLVTVLFLAIASVWDISEKVEDYIDSQVSLRQLLYYYLFNFTPHFGVMLSPLFIFIAAVYFTSRMAARCEFVAILSAGMSLYRLLWPYSIASAFLTMLLYMANHYIVPVANRQKIAFDNTYVRLPYVFSRTNFHLQVDETAYVYLEHYNNSINEGYRFTLEKIVDGKLHYKLRADRIRWDTVLGKWTIFNYFIRTISDKREYLSQGERLDTILAFTPKDFTRKEDIVETMTTPELKKFVQRERLRGSERVEAYLVKLYERTASPFSTFVLTLIAVAIASRKTRGGTGLHLAYGFALAFGYIFVNRVFTTYSINAGLPPLAGVWLPTILFGVLSGILLRFAPK